MTTPTLEARLDRLAADVSLLVERQRRIDDLITEMSPILKEVMHVGTARLQDAETAGYFRAGKAALGAVDKVVRSHPPEELDELGDDLVRILETMRALTRPDVLQIAAEAAEVVHHRDELAPIGVLGLVRASSDVEVQRGLAVMMELLKHVGRAADRIAAPREPAKQTRPTPRTHPQLAQLAPKRRTLETPPAAAASCAVPTKPGPAATTIDGVAFTADGFLADTGAWTPQLGATLAAQSGIEMTEAHWALVNFARKEYLDSGVSPNIRRLSVATGTATKDIYTLFKKAPGRAIARIAGIPKPAGCL